MSGAIIMIKIQGRGGKWFNVNLDEIASVEYADPSLPVAQQFDRIVARGSDKPIPIVAGSFAAAVAALKAEFNPKLKDLIFIGTLP